MTSSLGHTAGFVLILTTLGSLAGNVYAQRDGGCNAISVGNTRYQSKREGVYTRLDSVTCSGRDVYKHKQGHSYLYYLTTLNGWYGWMIGSEVCQNLGGMAANEDTLSPHQVPREAWQEVNTHGFWVNTGQVNVECSDNSSGDLSAGAIAGIVIACLVVVIVVIVLVACCCCNNKNKRSRNPYPARRAPPPQTVNVYTSGPQVTGRPNGRPQVRPSYTTGGPNPSSRGHYLGPAVISSGSYTNPGYSGPHTMVHNNPVYSAAYPPPAYADLPPHKIAQAPPYRDDGGSNPGGSALQSTPHMPSTSPRDPAYPPVAPAAPRGSDPAYPPEPPPSYTTFYEAPNSPSQPPAVDS